jgi:hypothetical protein
MSEYDDILFNNDDKNRRLINFCNNTQWHNPSEAKKDRDKLIKLLGEDIYNNKYFSAGTMKGYHKNNMCPIFMSYIFKNYIVDLHSLYENDYYNYECIKIIINKHNIPNNILFAIKHFQYHNCFPNDFSFIEKNYNIFDVINRFDIYNKHPEYFTTQIDKNISNELQIIKSEKNKILTDKELLIKHEQKIISENQIIIKQKEELDKLILENHQKINYYKNLEDQIISINKDKAIIQEEKRKLAIVKEKMAKNKKEFDDEKLKFLIEKDRINEIDIDKFINSVLD